ncbi:hypothetical protein CYLTODRAFT_249580 [Cylindrobasidium torrendii FP15055 ss-10]|uniref:Uncharacterized protein n=1 Tax=Cylindrobasidium torrendii FP15055 ss-10 TaxID=1314674 RepID=A0A0D7BGS8_9AGAR|nr:hypothetical protein CYLTODRAFT_249580 [Cylindrobasidium torrendii FP15055 ss-10]
MLCEVTPSAVQQSSPTSQPSVGTSSRATMDVTKPLSPASPQSATEQASYMHVFPVEPPAQCPSSLAPPAAYIPGESAQQPIDFTQSISTRTQPPDDEQANAIRARVEASLRNAAYVASNAALSPQNFTTSSDFKYDPGSRPHSVHASQLFSGPPSVERSRAAADALDELIRPRRGPGSSGYKPSPYSEKTTERLRDMRGFLTVYSTPASKCYGRWTDAAQEIAIAQRRGLVHYAVNLKRWATQFIEDHSKIPYDSNDAQGTSH